MCHFKCRWQRDRPSVTDVVTKVDTSQAVVIAVTLSVNVETISVGLPGPGGKVEHDSNTANRRRVNFSIFSKDANLSCLEPPAE
jgi:hypothetical protein